ncbi:MAG: hypothetical protein JSU96_19580, partial [Acidobacteriota bacterium]
MASEDARRNVTVPVAKSVLDSEDAYLPERNRLGCEVGLASGTLTLRNVTVSVAKSVWQAGTLTLRNVTVSVAKWALQAGTLTLRN